MGMAQPDKPPRAPYKMDNGLMYCEACPCTYSRGSDEGGHFWSGRYTNKNKTTPPNFIAHGCIPDDVCPRCRTKEEPQPLTKG